MSEVAVPHTTIRTTVQAAATYGAAITASFLLANLKMQSAQLALIFTVAAPASAAAFVLLRAAASRFSFRTVLGISGGLSVAIFAGGLYLAAGCHNGNRYCVVVTMGVTVFFTTIVIPPATFAAWLAARFDLPPPVRGKVLAASAAMLLAVAAPGAWTAISEAPFRALVRHDLLAAGKVLWRAVISNPGGEVGNGENHVRRAVRAGALRCLPPAVQIEFARSSDATGAAARSALSISLYDELEGTKALLLAEIKRQGGAASGLETGWLFETVAVLAPRDQRIRGLLRERLALIGAGGNGAASNEALALAAALAATETGR